MIGRKIKIGLALVAVLCSIAMGQAKPTPPALPTSKPQLSTPAATFKAQWKEFNAALRSNNSAIVIIFFTDAKTKPLSDHPIADAGGAKGFTYVRVVLTQNDLDEADKIADQWRTGENLFDIWDNKHKKPAEIAALYDVTSIPQAVLCDQNFNMIERYEDGDIFLDITQLKVAAEAISERLKTEVEKAVEHMEEVFAKEKEKGKFTTWTIHRIAALARFNKYGDKAREMLKEINDAGEEELNDAVEKNDKKKIADIVTHYRGIPISTEADKAKEEAKEKKSPEPEKAEEKPPATGSIHPKK